MQAMTTVKPVPARASATASPKPLLAPVTIAVAPKKSQVYCLLPRCDLGAFLELKIAPKVTFRRQYTQESITARFAG